MPAQFRSQVWTVSHSTTICQWVRLYGRLHASMLWSGKVAVRRMPQAMSTTWSSRMDLLLVSPSRFHTDLWTCFRLRRKVVLSNRHSSLSDSESNQTWFPSLSGITRPCSIYGWCTFAGIQLIWFLLKTSHLSAAWERRIKLSSRRELRPSMAKT